MEYEAILYLWNPSYAVLGNEIQAQSPCSYTINDEKGLPSNEVYQVKQDAFGFMWIACNAGLY